MEKFFKKLKHILYRNRYIAEERRNRGDFFNIFSILKVERKEVKHSAFFYTLLNNKGEHGLGNKFLSAFIQEVVHKQKNIGFNYNSNDIYIKTEEPTEAKDGRMDIYIKSEGKIIIIENKIDALDGEKQLIRYENYVRAQGKEHCLLYLTLDGKEADGISTTNEKGEILKVNEDYYPISYKEHILKWLERCLEISVSHSMVRETIKQYINLVKKITNTENNMYKELESFFCKEENWELTAKIIDTINIDELKNRIMEKVLEHLVNKLNDLFECEWSYEYDKDKIKPGYNGYYPAYRIIPNTWRALDNNYLFYFGLHNCGRFGIYSNVDKNSHVISNETKNLLPKELITKVDGATPFGYIDISEADCKFEGRVSEENHKSMIEHIKWNINFINDNQKELEKITIEETFYEYREDRKYNLAKVLPKIELKQRKQNKRT